MALWGREPVALTPPPLLGLSDQPIAGRADDTLSLSKEADAIAEFVAGCTTPLTLAIQGDWGSGKTSLLRMIEEKLDPKRDGVRIDAKGAVEVIRFETWQYAQFGGGPGLPLSLLSMLARRLSPPGRMAEIGQTFGRIIAPIAATAARYASGGAMEVGEWFGSSGADFAQQCEDLRAQLAKIVREKLSGRTRRVVIMVDDLDRVAPETAVDILQAIKMFLDLEGCVFILALDFAVVKDGVRTRFGITDDAKARAFFDKIIQLPFHVPVAKYDLERFLINQLNGLSDPHLGRAEMPTVLALAAASVSANPRALKRVINALQLTTLRARDDLAELGKHRAGAMLTLFGLLCMQSRFPAGYAWLARQPDLSAAIGTLTATEDQGADAPMIGVPGDADNEAFGAFARLFALAAADLLAASPAGFARVLDVTSATSVAAPGSSYKFNAESREANKSLMDEVLAACQTMIPGVTLRLKAERGALAVVADGGLGIQLLLEHGQAWMGVFAKAPDRGDEVVQALGNPRVDVAEDAFISWEHHLGGTTPLHARRELLQAGPDAFKQAWDKLERAGLVG